ncbi:MAG: hypothetical protein QXW35_05475 [Candidatus Aenigmatarchaeota archaeon]
MHIRYIIISILMLLFTIDNIHARKLKNCLDLENYIKNAHYFYFGVDFPYWYSISQAQKESNCRHNITSLDGIGSEGFAQITYRWWKSKLDQQNIPEIRSLHNHARAQAYINYEGYKNSRCKKLFEMYQIYNGGYLVSRELARANSCNWEDGFKACNRKDICVWQTKDGCKQWRNACDINYSYSLKIYELGQLYSRGLKSTKYQYW